MVGVITGFVGVFKDGGLSIATVQRPDVSDAQVSTLFWINAALGGSAALLLALVSPLVAWFYHDRSLIWIVVALAVPFVLGGLCVQLQALLQRQMRFRDIAIIEIVSLILSAAVGILAAAAGWGSWALITMTIAAAAVTTALTFFFCRWRPSRPAIGSGVRAMLTFGGALTANKLLDGLTGSVDILLLGKLFSPDTVGYYTRAQTLMLQPLSQLMPPVTNVALPVLSRLAEQPAALKRTFIDLLQLTSFASSFVAVYIVVCGDWLIGVFLGPQWANVSGILRLLTGASLFLPLSTVCVLGLTAQGKGSALVRWGLLKNALLIAAMVSGVAWGAKGIAAALSAVSVCILLPILVRLTAGAGLAPLKEVWRAIGPGLGLCVLGCGVLYSIREVCGLESRLAGLGVILALNSAMHVSAMSALPSCRRALARLLGARAMRP